MAGLTAVAVLGIALSAVSAIRQGNAAKNEADFAANQAEQRASQTRRAAADNERDARRDASRRRGSSIASQGGGGGAIGTGSSLLTEEDFVSESERQFGRIQQQGEFDAVGLENEAILQRSKGKSAQTAGYMSAGATVLSGAGALGKSFGGVKKVTTISGGDQSFLKTLPRFQKYG